MISKIIFLFVTLFGIGKIKKIPGSVASLATTIFLFFLIHILKISPNQINIKGKTTEKLGLIGKEKAIACEVITSVSKYD